MLSGAQLYLNAQTVPHSFDLITEIVRAMYQKDLANILVNIKHILEWIKLL